MVAGKALIVAINVYKKLCLPVITSNKKHSSKRFIPLSYTLEKRFGAAATFEGL